MKKAKGIRLVRPKTVLATENKPVQLPFQLTILWIVALDHFQAHWIIWVGIGIYLFFTWASALYHFSWDRKVRLESILEAVILPQFNKDMIHDQGTDTE